MKKLIFIIFFSLFLSNNIFAQYQDNQKLPFIIHGPFATPLYENGKIYFEKTLDENYPINFVLEYFKSNEKNKFIIDRYAADGANIIELPEKDIDMEVVSVFFYTIQKEDYIFTLVRRGVIHKGIGLYGDAYKVYAYTKDKDGILKLDEKIANDNNLSGIEGISNWKETHFKYKTVKEIKKYIDKIHS